MRAFFGILGLAGAGFMISSVSSLAAAAAQRREHRHSRLQLDRHRRARPAPRARPAAAATRRRQRRRRRCFGPRHGLRGQRARPRRHQQRSLHHRRLHRGRRRRHDSDRRHLHLRLSDRRVAPTATVTSGGWHITLNAPGMATARSTGRRDLLQRQRGRRRVHRRHRSHGRQVRHQRNDHGNGLHGSVLDQRQRARRLDRVKPRTTKTRRPAGPAGRVRAPARRCTVTSRPRPSWFRSRALRPGGSPADGHR